jgi:hypothetical protein
MLSASVLCCDLALEGDESLCRIVNNTTALRRGSMTLLKVSKRFNKFLV